MNFKKLRALLIPLVIALPLSAAAGPFSSLFIFGDSLSDTGNLAKLSPGDAPNPLYGPYDGGRYSNGPLWVEGLATGLGLTGQAAPVFLGGNNYAFAGARTGADAAPPGVLAQAVGLWGGGGYGLQAHASADPNALYVVVGGGNDMRDARSNALLDSAGLKIAAANAVNNLANTVGYLASLGAKNILISTLPDLGYTPEAVLGELAGFSGLVSRSSEVSGYFNNGILGLMQFGTNSGLDMHLLDMAALTADVRANQGDYGITNTKWPCAGFLYSAYGGNVSCDQSSFSDVLHPSAYAHSLIARAALDVLGVPEPDSLALFGLAIVALAVARRKSLASGKAVTA